MKLRHVMGISGGKDSTALAIYLRQKYPEIDIEYYFCDTDKELPETYEYLDKLEVFLGKKIKRIPERINDIHLFDQQLEIWGGFLPSVRQRWCTVQMKLRPFEVYVGKDNVISYVGIRGDEERSAYISKLPNIQSIFPFRKNLWSDDVVLKVFNNQNIESIIEIYESLFSDKLNKDFISILEKQISPDFDLDKKIKVLLEIDTKTTNYIIFNFLKTTDYPLGKEEYFPLLENDDVLGIEDIYNLLDGSGLGLPKYYNKIEYELESKKGYLSRSRSGCYFCFFQQRIEWVWLYEQHPELFQKAMEYEKDGYTWIQDESLKELSQPERIKDIKRKNIIKKEKDLAKSSNYLIDSLEFDEDEACTVCTL